jgi:hypothetical protein
MQERLTSTELTSRQETKKTWQIIFKKGKRLSSAAGSPLWIDWDDEVVVIERRSHHKCIWTCRRWLTDNTLASVCIVTVGWDSAEGTASRYELDGLRIQSRWGKIFRTHPDRPWGPTIFLHNRYRFSFPGIKRPGRGANHPPPIQRRG